MIDRRLFVVVVLVVVSVFALHVATCGSPDPVVQSSSGDQTIAFDPLPEVTVVPTSSAAELVEDPPSTSSIAGPDPVAAQDAGPAVPSTVSEVEVLVESRRPAIEAVQVASDQDHDDGGLAAPGSEDSAPVEQVAAELAVASRTWRFDDADTRQVDAITQIATGDVVTALVPSSAELQRRKATSEVSWVIIRDISVNGTEATVTFDQHLVTSASAETATPGTVVVDIVDGVVIDVSF